MGTFDHESLWNKSVVFIHRGIEARNEGRFEEFEFWASLTLELLGKAALATIHPTLVADPSHWQSLFAACGNSVGTSFKSIQAKTVYERLQHLSKSFDQDAMKFCLLMADRRNSELHSGELPFAGRNVEAWTGRFWQIVVAILQIQGKSLADWVGPEEAKGADAIIAKALTAMQQAITARIERHRDVFNKSAPPESPTRSFLQQRAKSRSLFRMAMSDESDGAASWECPACGSTGVVWGPFYDTEGEPEVEWDELAGSGREYVQAVYTLEGFDCDACDLPLRGRPELDAAEFDESFEATIEREPDDGDAYGND